MAGTPAILNGASVVSFTWGVQVVKSPIFFSRGMEADRNVKVVGGYVAVL